MIKRLLVTLFLLLMFYTKLICQPSIKTPTLLPQPTSAYSLTLVTGYTTPIQSFKISKSYTVDAAQKTMTMEACYWIPPTSATIVSFQKDDFTIGQLSPGIYTVHFSAIRSTSSNICVSYTSTTKTFTFEIFDDAVSVPQEAMDPSGYFYPNPVKDLLYVEMPNTTIETSRFSLYNALGELVQKEEFLGTKQVIDMSRFASGIYFLEIQSASVPKYIRIIKE